MKVCPICGKNRVIFWPEHWVYRRGATYYCSEQCLEIDLFRDMKLMDEVKRKRRKGLIMEIQERNKKAVEIAMSGESPLPFLKTAGAKNPSATWVYIRKCALKENPTLQIPATFGNKKPEGNMTRMYTLKKPATAGDAMEAAKDAADEFFGKCEDMGLRLGKDEAKEKPVDRIVGPCHIDKFLITAIKHPELGEFYYDKKFQKVDWRTDDGDEISMSPAAWYNLLKDLPHVLRILGV